MVSAARSRVLRLSGGLLAAGLVLVGVQAAGCACDAEPVVARVVTLAAFPARVDAGGVPVLGRVDVDVVVANQGNEAWLPAGPPVVEGPGWSWTSGCDAPLAPNALCTARLRFAPATEGPAAGSFGVTAPGADGVPVVLNVPLAGTGLPARVRLSPPALDFGNVVLGRSETRTATVENLGVDPITVPLQVQPPFRIDGADAARDVVVDGGGAVSVAVVFAPTQPGAAAGVLRAALCGPACGPAVTLSGTSTTPRIDVAPRVLDLGAVVVGATGTGTLTVTNAGDGPLSLQQIRVDGDPAVVASPPTLPATLEPGATLPVVVAWSPAQGAAAVDAVVSFASDDPLAPLVFVPVRGGAAGPGLTVSPTAMHLGFLAPDAARRGAVVVRSVGDAPVQVSAIRLDGGGGSFSLADVPPPGPLAPGASLRFFVEGRATPAAVAAGGAQARVVVSTAELSERGMDVTLAAGTRGCIPRAIVGHVALGAVRLREQAGGEALIENAGDAECALVGVRSGDDVGLPFDPVIDFSVTGLRTLAPGATGAVRFGFVPVAVGPASATVVVDFADVVAPVLVSASGRGVRGGLVAAPSVVTLGPIPTGCADPQGDLLLVNDGAERLTVDALTVDDGVGAGAAAFDLALPALPFELLPGASRYIGVLGRGRSAPGQHEAVLRATSDVGDASARLALTVTDGAVPVEERFVAADVDAVDILFVVDNSGSMADDQQLLAENFAAFFGTALDDRGIDFQVGVTTTDVLTPAGARGRLVGDVLTRSTPDLAAAFAAQVQVGIDGAPLELGLEALRLALADGANDSLFRTDAALSVVFVTDEEDAGAFVDLLPDPALSRAPDEYVALLLARKGGARANAPVLVSAVLNPGGARRYEALVDRFAGTRLDITRPDWGAQLGEIGVDTFTLSRSFLLASDAEAGSIVVEVDGRPTTAFAYDTARRAVVLDEAPGAGAEVVVRYVAGCA